MKPPWGTGQRSLLLLYENGIGDVVCSRDGQRPRDCDTPAWEVRLVCMGKNWQDAVVGYRGALSGREDWRWVGKCGAVMAECRGIEGSMVPPITLFSSQSAALAGFLAALGKIFFMRQKCLLAERVGAVAEKEILDTTEGIEGKFAVGKFAEGGRHAPRHPAQLDTLQ